MTERDTPRNPKSVAPTNPWSALPRYAPSRVELLLDDDFVEIGASGRRWERDAIIAELAGSPEVESNVPALSVRSVDAHVAMVEYVTATPDRRVLRSSWWRRCDGGWRCFSHQATVARSSQ